MYEQPENSSSSLTYSTTNISGQILGGNVQEVIVVGTLEDRKCGKLHQLKKTAGNEISIKIPSEESVFIGYFNVIYNCSVVAAFTPDIHTNYQLFTTYRRVSSSVGICTLLVKNLNVDAQVDLLKSEFKGLSNETACIVD